MYQNWHSHSIQDILKQLKTSSNKGVSRVLAKKRLVADGPNTLPRKKSLSGLRLFFAQFNNSLMYILLITVAISFSIGHYSDSIFVLIVILINTIVGYYQESKANNSLQALQEMVRIRVKVIRDGVKKEIDSEKLVRGDIIFLSPGDKVPADCRIIESRDFKVDESSLTGEWLSVDKKSESLAKETALVDQYNMVFMGTSVEVGEAQLVVVRTAVRTEFGKIVQLVKQTEEPQTPLQKKITHLSRIVGAFVVGLIVIIIIQGYFAGRDFAEIFVTSLALAVSAIPEGLLPAITVILVLAMRRIIKQKGIVKKLSAAESLGSVTVVCSDKTGTLTEGKMCMSHVVTKSEELLPSKKNEHNTSDGLPSDEMALSIASLTNDAYIENPQDELHEWVVRGYLTDKALLLSAPQTGLDLQKLESDYQLIEKQSFSSHKRYALSLRSNKQRNLLFVVGAPEELIERSSRLYANGAHFRIDDEDKKELRKKITELTSKGLRVVSCAVRDITSKKSEKQNLDEVVENLSFVGFVALRDPVRKDAKDTISEIKRAGIRPIIITGDHKRTALAVAEDVGLLASEDQIFEGADIEKMSGVQLKKQSKKAVIYARALPEHKLKIIKALHQNNEVVAMFGDGVNDAPALKAADIGVAVGSGTDVAKEVADIILLEDNFKTIVKAIEQGRVAFANIRKVFIYLVADDFTEIILFIGAMSLGLPLPLLAAQILWINLIEDGLPDIALTTEQETEGVMDEKPRDPDEPILSPNVKKWMLTVFSINGLLTFLFFWMLYKTTMDIDRARTLVFALMAFDSLAFAYSVRSLKRSVLRKDIFSNKILNWAVLASFILLIVAIYVPIVQRFLGTVAIGLNDWLLIISITIFEMIIIEFFKKLFLGEKKRKKSIT